MFTVAEGLEYVGEDFIKEEPDVSGDGKADGEAALGVVEEEKRPTTELQTQQTEVSLIRFHLFHMVYLCIS